MNDKKAAFRLLHLNSLIYEIKIRKLMNSKIVYNNKSERLERQCIAIRQQLSQLWETIQYIEELKKGGD